MLLKMFRFSPFRQGPAPSAIEANLPAHDAHLSLSQPQRLARPRGTLPLQPGHDGTPHDLRDTIAVATTLLQHNSQTSEKREEPRIVCLPAAAAVPTFGSTSSGVTGRLQ